MDPMGGLGGQGGGPGGDYYNKQQQQQQPVMMPMHQQQQQGFAAGPFPPGAFPGGLPQAGQGRPGRAFDRHDPAFYKTRMCTQVSSKRIEEELFFSSLTSKKKHLSRPLSLSPLSHSLPRTPRTRLPSLIPVPGRHLHLRRPLHLCPRRRRAPQARRRRLQDERRSSGSAGLGRADLAHLLPLEHQWRVPLWLAVRVRAHLASSGGRRGRRGWICE